MDKLKHTSKKLAKCLSAPILTSSKSFIRPLKIGTKSCVATSSPTITANSCILDATVRRTFH